MAVAQAQFGRPETVPAAKVRGTPFWARAVAVAHTQNRPAQNGTLRSSLKIPVPGRPGTASASRHSRPVAAFSSRPGPTAPGSGSGPLTRSAAHPPSASLRRSSGSLAWLSCSHAASPHARRRRALRYGLKSTRGQKRSRRFVQTEKSRPRFHGSAKNRFRQFWIGVFFTRDNFRSRKTRLRPNLISGVFTRGKSKIFGAKFRRKIHARQFVISENFIWVGKFLGRC